MKVCTDRAKYHHALSRLGLTNVTTQDEISLLGGHNMSIVSNPSNRIFLMENRQIIMEDPSSATFPEDMANFLNLNYDLKPLKHFEKRKDKYDVESEAYSKRINICDEEHDEVRRELVSIGRDASRWIVDYFVKSSRVTTTQPDLFVRLLEDWKIDPCDDTDPGLRRLVEEERLYDHPYE